MKNKVIVIIGDCGALGEQYCQAVAEHGVTAVVADVNEMVATSVAENISLLYSKRADAACLDSSNKISINTLIDNLHKKYGHIDAIVNNAYPRNKEYGKNQKMLLMKVFVKTSVYI